MSDFCIINVTKYKGHVYIQCFTLLKNSVQSWNSHTIRDRQIPPHPSVPLPPFVERCLQQIGTSLALPSSNWQALRWAFFSVRPRSVIATDRRTNMPCTRIDGSQPFQRYNDRENILNVLLLFYREVTNNWRACFQNQFSSPLQFVVVAKKLGPYLWQTKRSITSVASCMYIYTIWCMYGFMYKLYMRSLICIFNTYMYFLNIYFS